VIIFETVRDRRNDSLIRTREWNIEDRLHGRLFATAACGNSRTNGDRRSFTLITEWRLGCRQRCSGVRPSRNAETRKNSPPSVA
jgi:hypothetical protein